MTASRPSTPSRSWSTRVNSTSWCSTRSPSSFRAKKPAPLPSPGSHLLYRSPESGATGNLLVSLGDSRTVFDPHLIEEGVRNPPAQDHLWRTRRRRGRRAAALAVRRHPARPQPLARSGAALERLEQVLHTVDEADLEAQVAGAVQAVRSAPEGPRDMQLTLATEEICRKFRRP